MFNYLLFDLYYESYFRINITTETSEPESYLSLYIGPDQYNVVQIITKEVDEEINVNPVLNFFFALKLLRRLRLNFVDLMYVVTMVDSVSIGQTLILMQDKFRSPENTESAITGRNY